VDFEFEETSQLPDFAKSFPATGDDAELAKVLKVLQSRLGARVQPLLAWDRRVDLAVVLARAKIETLAKKQLELCVADIDEAKIRSLSPASVYRLLVLCRGFEVTMPPDQRAKIEAELAAARDRQAVATKDAK
jgi:hypothetical protein